MLQTNEGSWKHPALHTHDGAERKASWLELFFDVVFVVVIAQLSHDLASDISLKGVASFTLLFIPVWFIWVGCESYASRFETDGIDHRLIVFAEMLVVACLAHFARDPFGSTSVGFALSYTAAKFLLVLLMLRAAYYNVEFRSVALRNCIGFTLGGLCFVASVFVPVPWRFALWGVGLLVDLGTPLLTTKHRRELPSPVSSKTPERFGLFTIIVLGEAVVAVIHGVSSAPAISVATALTAVLGMGLIFSMAWVYFDSVEHHSRKMSAAWSVLWIYLHAPFVAGVVVVGACIGHVVAAPIGEQLPVNIARGIVASSAIALAAVGMLQLTLKHTEKEQRMAIRAAWSKILTAAIMGVLCCTGVAYGPVLLLLILIVAFLPHMRHCTVS